MNIEEIVKKYLSENGYDGLYCEDANCACIIDDLFPCRSDCSACESGYLQKEKTDDGGFIIGKNKIGADDE